ncbi:MAG: TVP38/TMEM64 family protein [Deltaproteobacteria bacterium]|nr:TVP38/TMEM64 family protein [Deltaproteobacteria bacterium]
MSPRIRLALVGLVLVTLGLIAWRSGLTAMSLRELRLTIEGLGPLALLAFVGLFPILVLLGFPGMALVVAGSLVFGELVGFLASYVAGLLAVTLAFGIARGIGGQALAEIERPLVRRALASLDRRPIGTIVLLRSVFWFAPPLSFAFALSSLTFKDYLAGSILGMFVPVLVGTLLAKVIAALV